jgi:hypothetical protein
MQSDSDCSSRFLDVQKWNDQVLTWILKYIFFFRIFELSSLSKPLVKMYRSLVLLIFASVGCRIKLQKFKEDFQMIDPETETIPYTRCVYTFGHEAIG